MLDTIKDYTNSFLGIILVLITILVIPEVKKSKLFKIIAGVGCTALLLLGIDKINRDNLIKKTDTDRIISLTCKLSSTNDSIIKILANRKRDSVSNSNYFSELKQIGVGRDSLTNKPTVDKRIFYTYIKSIENSTVIFR